MISGHTISQGIEALAVAVVQAFQRPHASAGDGIDKKLITQLAFIHVHLSFSLLQCFLVFSLDPLKAPCLVGREGDEDSSRGYRLLTIPMV